MRTVVAAALSVLILQSCVSEAAADTGNTDSACRAGTERAKKQVREGKYYIWVPHLPAEQAQYAEEMFYRYYGKEVEVTNYEMLCIIVDPVVNAADNCYDHYMDSIAGTWGTNVAERIRAGADSLFRAEPERYHRFNRGYPMFPGGDSALYASLRKNIRYPQTAKNDSIQGKVVVRAEIDTLGKITGATIYKSLHPDLDSAVIYAVRRLPDFHPAYVRGKKVPSSKMIPVSFKLD